MLQPNLNLPRYFRVQLFCFKNIGIDPIAEKRIVKNYFWNLIPFLAQFACYIAICDFAAKHIQDVDELSKALVPLWQMTLSLLKWFTLMYKRREMVRFIKRILSWNLEACEAEVKLIVKENKLDTYFCRSYLFLVASTGYIAVVNPLLNGIYFYLVNGEFHLEPIVKATYLWDITTPLGYTLAAVWITIGTHSLIYTSVGIDSLYSWITHNIIAQFSVLEMRLKQTSTENEGYTRPDSISDCITYHCRILDTVKELNSVFGFVIFVKFTISCLQVCFIAFQFNRIKNFADAAFQIGFLICVSLQLLLYCLNAQRIRDKSLNVASCIFKEFEWDKLSLTSQKILLIIIIRAQRECNVSGIFFNIDMTLFLWVFKTAGSFLALLKTLDEK